MVVHSREVNNKEKRMNTRRWFLLAVALFALVLPACAAGAEGPKVGDKVVDFQLKSVNGRLVKTAEARKDRVFVLKMGATWCGWCNKQIPHLNKVQQEYGNKVAVIDVDIEEPLSRVKTHNEKNGVKYTTVLDTNGQVAARYGVQGIPVLIIADKDGKIVYRGNYTEYEVLKAKIDELLKPKGESAPAPKG